MSLDYREVESADFEYFGKDLRRERATCFLHLQFEVGQPPLTSLVAAK